MFLCERVSWVEGRGRDEDARHARLALLGKELLLENGVDGTPGELQVRDVDPLLGFEERDGHVRRDVDQARVHAREDCRLARQLAPNEWGKIPHT